jgi:uncharacterized membrane protein
MNTYLVIKTLHILSSVLMVGTGFGSAFYLYFTNHSKSVPAISAVTKLIVRADWWFTTPAVIFQPLSGLWLAYVAGWPWGSSWIVLSLVLFVFAGMCWVPAVLFQLHMEGLAKHAEEMGTELLPSYWRYAKLWEWMGYLAFPAMLAVYFLMVLKPA